MSPKTIYWLRWLTFIPAAFLGGVVSYYIIRVSANMLLTDSFLPKKIQDGIYFFYIKIFGSLVYPAAFLTGGLLMVPARQKLALSILSILQTIGIILTAIDFAFYKEGVSKIDWVVVACYTVSLIGGYILLKDTLK